jgi:hypothetical protein
MIPNSVRDACSTHALFDLQSTSNIHHNMKISSPAKFYDISKNFNTNEVHVRTCALGCFQNLTYTGLVSRTKKDVSKTESMYRLAASQISELNGSSLCVH